MLRIIFVCLLLVNYVHAQVRPVQFEELKTLQEKEQKLVMVLIETDWCKYCQAMKHAISKNKQVSATLNKSFYTLFLNAEHKQTINFAGKRFIYKPNGINTGSHQLANHLGTIEGQLWFPSICFLNAKNEIVYQHGGFLDSSSMLKLLNALVHIRKDI
ncbi:MAG TPA: thioredoxin family protein [Sphingobacteriaceae bacterium]|nr:thioredoxin family protein [Sphingobacteriaceae bacterium]